MSKGWRLRSSKMPLPPVIHNRALQLRRADQHEVTKLLLQGIQVFNVRNRYRKDHIHDMLHQDPALKKHLPYAAKATPESLAYMMEHYNDLIIKPCSGSIGHGIMRLYKRDGDWKLTCQTRASRKGWATFRLSRGQLPSATLRRIFRHAYLIEERIPLVRYEGRPVDLRVSVQRGLTVYGASRACSPRQHRPTPLSPILLKGQGDDPGRSIG